MFSLFGLNTVALRFGNVYGPGSMHKGSVVSQFIRSALNKEKFRFLAMDCKLVILSLSTTWFCRKKLQIKGIGGETFQIATNRETSIVELAINLSEILEKKGLQNQK